LEPSSLPQRSFWAKLVPFAVWIWITNLLANLFEICDRYMIIHYSGLDSIDALRMVGNYHSSRIIPVLFVGIASMIGAMITPHLSCDWERGNRGGVIARLNMVAKTTALVQFAAAVAVLMAAPLLFEVAFRNKLSGGMSVLPWALVYCSLFSLFVIVQNYLWCAERAGLSSLALFVGLTVSISANFLLLPVYGLQGAVWSATCANIVALGAMYAFSAMLGMRFDRGTWILSIAPISVGLGLWPALGVFVGVLTLMLATDWIFTAAEKRQLAGLAGGYITKVRQLIGRSHTGRCVNSAAP
jgi:polysaccharide transporter, PST family